MVKAVKATGAKKQLLLLPFNLGHKEIATVVSDMADKDIVFGNTTGFYDGSNGLRARPPPRIFYYALSLVRLYGGVVFAF